MPHRHSYRPAHHAPGLTAALAARAPGSRPRREAACGAADRGWAGYWERATEIAANSTDSGPPSLDGRHGIRTQVMLLPGDRTIAARTDIWSHTEQDSLVVSIWVLVATQSGRVVATGSPAHRESRTRVDPRSTEQPPGFPVVAQPCHRQVSWTARIPDDASDQALAAPARIHIVRVWNPPAGIDDVIDRAVRGGQTVEGIVATVAALARA
jgi:hypothetical protein